MPPTIQELTERVGRNIKRMSPGNRRLMAAAVFGGGAAALVYAQTRCVAAQRKQASICAEANAGGRAIVPAGGRKGKRKPGVSVDGVFLRRLIKILRTCIPHPASRAALLFYLQTGLLLARTGVTNYMTSLEARVAQNIVSRNVGNFRRSLFEFMLVAVPASLLNASMKWTQAEMGLALRDNLTAHVHARYTRSRAYYLASTLGGLGNADQRITEDVDKFCESVAEIYGYTLKPVVDIVLFTNVLGGLIGYKSLGVLLGNFVVSSAVLRLVSPPLSTIVSQEAGLGGAYRAAHQRLVAHAEEVAYNDPPGGEAELAILKDCHGRLTAHQDLSAFQKMWMSVYDNYLLKYGSSTVSLIVLTAQLNGGLMPFVHFLWSGDVALITPPEASAGDLTKQYIHTVRLLKECVTAGNNLVLVYKRVTTVAGHTSRVAELLESVQALGRPGGAARLFKPPEGLPPPAVPPTRAEGKAIAFEGLAVGSPDGTLLVRGLDIEIGPGGGAQNVIVTGPNGSGKSSLFRVLAGLWPAAEGGVTSPHTRDIFYLSQRPYLVTGCLRDQVLYPYASTRSLGRAAARKEDGAVRAALDEVELSYLEARSPAGLDAAMAWDETLSGGERQRLAMARMLYHKPQFAVLDECTSAVSADGERLLYERACAAGVTLLSIAHRHSVRGYHARELRFDGSGARGYTVLPVEDRVATSVPATAVSQAA